MLLFIIIKYSITKKEFLIKLLFLLLLPATYYEITVRSELLTNSVFVIGVFFLFEKFRAKEGTNKYYILSAVLLGLLLSTRLIVFLWLVPFIIYYFKYDLRNGLIFISISVTIFLISLIPFYFWSPELFVAKGPISIQIIYLPKWVYILFPVVVFYFGWKVRSFNELLFCLGVLTFMLVTISFAASIFNFGFNEAVFRDRFDISYYIFAVPFLILSLHEKATG